jgi:hypothetical protein
MWFIKLFLYKISHKSLIICEININRKLHCIIKPFNVYKISHYFRISSMSYTYGKVCVSTYTTSRHSDGLRAGRPGFDSWQGQDFSFLNSVYTGSEVHPTYYAIGTWGDFLGCKAAGTLSWPLTFILGWGQQWWSYTSTPPYILMAWCLIH